MFVKFTILFSVSILLFLNVVDCGPLVTDSASEPLSVCYSLKCPTDTRGCLKSSEISEVDRTQLLVQVRCYDERGNILKSRNLTEDNPFEPHAYYKGYTFSSVLKIPLSSRGENPTDNKEFHLGPDYSKTDNGPKSEVEDLNG